VAYFAAVSNDTQHRLAGVLEDADFTDEYLTRCRSDVRGNWDALRGALLEADIPFVEPRAGLFAVVDLRSMLPLEKEEEEEEAGGDAVLGLLPPSAYRGERMLQDRIFEDCKVVLTPGEAMHAPVPGLFRACFAWMPPASLQAAVRRIAALRLVIQAEKEAGTWAL